jgi:hypothetical protein
MSPRSSSPKPAPEPGIYDGLLVVSTAALLTGIIFLAMHLNNYGWDLAG